MGTPVLFGLNVARDLTDAAHELEVNRRDLAEWAALDSDGVAEVYGAGEARFLWFGHETTLPLVAVRWFDTARELHVVRDPVAPNRSLCVLVNEFRPSAAPLQGMTGSLLNESVSDRFWGAIVAKRTRLAHIDWQTGIAEAPGLELDYRGDVVGELRRGDTRRLCC